MNEIMNTVKTVEICTTILFWAGNKFELCDNHTSKRLIEIEIKGDSARLAVYNGIKRCSDCEIEVES